MVRRTPPTDRNKVKIASFRISEGEWFDFSEEADRQNVTATDVIKGSIRLFMAGTLELPEPPETQPELPPYAGSVDDIKEIARAEARSLIDQAINPLGSEVAYLRECMAGVASIDYVEKALEPLHLAISKASTHTDFDPAAIQVYIDQQMEKIRAEITAMGATSSTKPDRLTGAGKSTQEVKNTKTSPNRSVKQK
jgi:hypothetical protein